MSKPSNPNRLYFGSVSFEKTEDQIRGFFSQCGEIEDIYLVKDKFSSRFQGYGFITFATKEGRNGALELNGTEFEGRTIKINLESKASDKTKTGQRLFIKNIPQDKTEDDIKQAFAHYGSVDEFFFVKDRMTKVSKGFGFMDMSTAEEAQAALEMDGKDPFGNGGLSVKIAHQKKPVNQSAYGPVHGGGYGAQPYNPYGGFGGPPAPYGGQAPWQQGGYGGGYGGRGGRGRGRGGGRGGYGRSGPPPPQYGAAGGFGGPPQYGAPQQGGYGGPPQGGYQAPPQQGYGAPQQQW